MNNIERPYYLTEKIENDLKKLEKEEQNIKDKWNYEMVVVPASVLDPLMVDLIGIVEPVGDMTLEIAKKIIETHLLRLTEVYKFQGATY